ncbi:MAG: hypothetical protein A3J79_02930 [Elusimicrobia bacterium RIFOXYB2_FULL_62_6]|nr:MAG: hypothetical protein A3J79_02930 [Elusimicrobia bacterium RIFOXYB2_FULL_62_6]
MEIDEKIDMLEKNLARQLDWIRAADSKVAPIIFLTSSMLGASAAALSRTTSITPLTLTLMLLTVIPLLAALVCIAMASFPHFNPDTGSIIFFGSVNQAGLSSFERRASEITRDEYFRDLSAMCYNSAHIANLKFRHVKRAMVFLLAGIVPWVTLIYDVFHSYNIAAMLR